MDVWGTIVLFVNILLLFAGWILFQQAKSDLTARAAQIPVLSEVKALQKSVAGLLEQLKMESIQISAQLDARCAEARDLLATIDRKLEESRQSAPRGSRKRVPASPVGPGSTSTAAVNGSGETAATAAVTAREPDTRREQVYRLADEGLPPTEVARRTGFSEGEVELILGLRPQAS